MVFTSSVELAFRRDAILKAQSSKAWYLLCLAEESMIFTSSVELAFQRDAILEAQSSKAWYLMCSARLSRAVFRSHCNSEGLVEQSAVFTVFSKAQSSWLFKITAILKAKSSKAWYLLCLVRYLQAQSSCLFEVTAILKA